MSAPAMGGAICTGCGCTDDHACITEHGPCSWVAPGLCSACALPDLRWTTSTPDHRNGGHAAGETKRDPHPTPGQRPVLPRTAARGPRPVARALDLAGITTTAAPPEPRADHRVTGCQSEGARERRRGRAVFRGRAGTPTHPPSPPREGAWGRNPVPLPRT